MITRIIDNILIVYTIMYIYIYMYISVSLVIYPLYREYVYDTHWYIQYMCSTPIIFPIPLRDLCTGAALFTDVDVEFVVQAEGSVKASRPPLALSHSKYRIRIFSIL